MEGGTGAMFVPLVAPQRVDRVAAVDVGPVPVQVFLQWRQLVRVERPRAIAEERALCARLSRPE